MIRAFARALDQLFDPAILRVLGASVALSLVCFVLVWSGVGWLLFGTDLFDIPWLETTLDVLGGLVTLVVTWFLFPMLASTFVGLFLERVATAVEARHYPWLPKAPGQPWWETIGPSLRFLGIVVGLNLLLLPLWLVPILYPIAYYVVNGFLLGREYFELVALRRLDRATVRSLHFRHGSELLAMGVVGAFLITVPIANFLVPVVLTAAMVHRCEEWRQAGGG